MTTVGPLVWDSGEWNGAVWGPAATIETETPYTTQACVSYTPTFPNVPVPPTARYINIITPGPVLYFKPGIYWERCIEAYVTPSGSVIYKFIWNESDWDSAIWG